MNLKLRLLLFFGYSLVFLKVSAQTAGNSPYSVLGLGDMSAPGFIRNEGMGGTGISNGHVEFINIQNPALLPVNKGLNFDSTIRYTMLEAGFMGQIRNLSTKSTTSTTSGFNIEYFSFAFPISKSWTSSFGLRPFSSFQNRYYSYLGIDKIQNANIISAINDYSMKGALNQVQFSNGFDLTRNFSAGLMVGYIFGNVIEQSETQAQLLQDGSFSANTGTHIQTYYSGFQLKPGFSYKGALKDSSGNRNGTYFNAGFTLDYFPYFTADQGRKLVAKDPYDGITVLSDTIKNFYKLSMPVSSNFGVSLSDQERWTLALDFTYAPWSYFNDRLNSYPGTSMNDSYTVALGGEVKPGRLSLTSREYRAGIRYSKSPITINNIQLDDYSLSVGTTFAFGRKDARFKNKPLTKINAALVVGNRGTTSANLIREQYFRIHFGLLIHDKWFQRWRID